MQQIFFMFQQPGFPSFPLLPSLLCHMRDPHCGLYPNHWPPASLLSLPSAPPPWPFWSGAKHRLTQHMSEHVVRRVSVACLSSKSICVIAIISSNGLLGSHGWFSYCSACFASNSSLGCKLVDLMKGKQNITQKYPIYFSHAIQWTATAFHINTPCPEQLYLTLINVLIKVR